MKHIHIRAWPELRTPQRWKIQFAAHHLSQFAVAIGLRNALAASAAVPPRTRSTQRRLLACAARPSKY
jgi:hypothetical protein